MALAVRYGGVAPFADQHPTVLVAVAVDDDVPRHLPRDEFVDDRSHETDVAGIDEAVVQDVLADPFPLQPAEHRFRTVVPSQHTQVRLPLDHRQRRVFKMGRENLVPAGFGILRHFQLGDVHHHAGRGRLIVDMVKLAEQQPGRQPGGRMPPLDFAKPGFPPGQCCRAAVVDRRFMATRTTKDGQRLLRVMPDEFVGRTAENLGEIAEEMPTECRHTVRKSITLVSGEGGSRCGQVDFRFRRFVHETMFSGRWISRTSAQ